MSQLSLLVGIRTEPPGRHHLVSLFMHGVRLRGLHALVSVPSWDLSIVLEGLSELPSELLE